MEIRRGIAVLIAFLGAVCSAPAQAGSLDDWAAAREVRGNFGMVLGTAASDPHAEALIKTELKGFILQGTVLLKRVHANADSILFRGTARGLLFLQHKAAVVGGQAAASEQLCSGAFEQGDFVLEIFPRDTEYQVQFSGGVPACAVTTQYPAFRRMAQIYGKWHEVYKSLDDYWAPLAAELKSARDEFAGFAAGGKQQEEITFSASSVPDWREDPAARFPVMHFYPLPSGSGTKLAGAGKVQLMLSTSIFPTVLSAEARWTLERK